MSARRTRERAARVAPRVLTGTRAAARWVCLRGDSERLEPARVLARLVEVFRVGARVHVVPCPRIFLRIRQVKQRGRVGKGVVQVVVVILHAQVHGGAKIRKARDPCLSGRAYRG